MALLENATQHSKPNCRLALGPGPSPTPTPTPTPVTGWDYAYYSYESAHPHAVATIVRDVTPDTFTYDASGNMTDRDEGGEAWDQGFDEEGRLESISDGSDTWSFTYDGDGVRVLQENPDGTTTLFLDGGSYEVHLSAGGEETLVRRYYGAAGQRVLLDGTDTFYLLTDHLGSVVAVADAEGDLVSEQRYLPYGEGRFTPGITQTDFSFTGQRNLAAVGLMDYHARWYDHYLSRFVSADTQVPTFNSPQALNRYTYVYNTPLLFTDPTGHGACIDEDCRYMVNPVSGETIDTKGEYIWLSGYFYQDLEQLHQSQEPDNPKDCASFSIAMSLNIIFGGEVSGADIAEHKSRPIIFQGKFRWYFPGQGPGLPPFSQDDLLNDIFDWFDLPYKAIYQKGGTVDNLIANLKAGDPTIVNISHGPNLLNGVGHAMVLVGYNKLSKEFILLDPAQDQGFHNYAMDQFLDVWLDQPNIFIKSGSMVTVNRLP